MPYDISMTSDLQLLALINDDNGSSIPREALTFGVPEAAQGVSPAGDTQVEITGVHNSGYKDSQIVIYDRIPLSEFTDHDGGPLQVEANGNGEIDVDAVRVAWNAYYGSALELTDIDPGMVLPTPVDFNDGDGFTLTIAAAVASLAYIGSTSIHVQPLDVDIATVILVRDLNGLTFNLPG